MIKGKDGLRRPGMYGKRGEGDHQFSMTEGSPKDIRKNAGDVKNVNAGREARTQDGYMNILPTYQSINEEARRSAAKANE